MLLQSARPGIFIPNLRTMPAFLRGIYSVLHTMHYQFRCNAWSTRNDLFHSGFQSGIRRLRGRRYLRVRRNRSIPDHRPGSPVPAGIAIPARYGQGCLGLRVDMANSSGEGRGMALRGSSGSVDLIFTVAPGRVLRSAKARRAPNSGLFQRAATPDGRKNRPGPMGFSAFGPAPASQTACGDHSTARFASWIWPKSGETRSVKIRSTEPSMAGVLRGEDFGLDPA